MSLRITLVHGWGYDATLWRDVLPLLADCDVELVDLGYFGDAFLPCPCAPPRLAVGHSYGALWWLDDAPLPWQRLLAINGFARFTATSDLPAGVAPRILARMQKRFVSEPAATLADFHALCGAPGPRLPADTRPLAAGLAELAERDGRATWHERHADIFALAAGGDAVVPPALSQATFAALPAGHLDWIADAGHLLPLTHPQECATAIRRLAEAP